MGLNRRNEGEAAAIASAMVTAVSVTIGVTLLAAAVTTLLGV